MGLPEFAASVRNGLRTVVLKHVAELESHRAAWQRLTEEAVEANVFFEPCVLLPSLRAFAGASDLSIVLVYQDPPAAQAKSNPPELIGFFPLERRRPSATLPLTFFRFWEGDYSYVPTPLVDRGRAPVAITAFFDWLAAQPRGQNVLAIDRLELGGPFHGLLIDEIARRRAHVAVRDSYTRALFEPDCDPQTYLARALPAKDRREIQRQRKRLNELGAKVVALTDPADALSWANEFLALEAGGWKGEQGSALASKAADAGFFREMFVAAFAAGRLSTTSLRIEGKPIAMQILLHAGSGAYGFKTCYDESYSKFAPGLHLEIDLIESMPSRAPMRWIDSAAAHYHPLFNRIYTERRCVERWLVTPDHAMGLMMSVIPVVRWARRSLFRAVPAAEVPRINKRGRFQP